MKMNKKTIIILIVVAVAVYLLWKRGKENAVIIDGGEVDHIGSGYDKNSLDDCISAAFGNDKYADIFAAQARKIYNYYNTPMRRAEYSAKASQKGYTFPQMATIDGAYVECYKQENGYWTPRDESHKAYFKTVVSRINAM